MALLLLVILGATLGWLTTILTRVEDRNGVLLHVAIGAAASVAGGLITNNGSIIGGLSLVALLVGIGSGVAALVGYGLWRERQSAN